ncbi:MAG: sugar phosphate isomerase/epimerase family protein [Planctomycetota bacterium]|jgi:sugar phosphate isomerase/epimerase
MKMDFVERMGIQSWCFRGLKQHEQVAEALKTCGMNRLELSHAHYKPWEVENQDEIVAFYGQEGITISCYGAFGIGPDEARARKVFDFATTAGFETIVVMFAEGGIQTAEKLCSEYGKRVAIHNHGRHDPDGAPWAIEAILKQTSPNVGLCLDTAWMIDSRFDPLEMAEKFADRLYGVHIKDFVFDRTGKPEDVIVGEGNLDLPGFLKVLDNIGFDGFFTLEYEGDVNDPVPATKRCVEAVRKAAGA